MNPARARFPVASPPPRVGLVRGLPHAYEMQAYTGRVVANNPHGRWSRGELVRGTQPAFVGPAAIGYYMWDRSEPNGWVGGGPAT